MAYVKDTSPTEDIVEFAEYLKEDFAARERRLAFREEQVAERERRVAQREAELWGGLPSVPKSPDVSKGFSLSYDSSKAEKVVGRVRGPIA